jgi:DNA-binding XRE family transcriptional regulator
MPVVVKTRHIKKTKFHFHFKKSTPRKILAEISNRYSVYFADDFSRDDELVDISGTDWFKGMEKEMKPKDYLKHLREANGLTQKSLGREAGINAAHISDYETGQRSISKEMARKFAQIFQTSPGIFI